MNNIAQSLYNISIEMQNLLNHNHFTEFGKLQRASKNLFQYGIENEIIFLKKEILDEYYEETYTIIGFENIFNLSTTGIKYQEKTFNY